MNGNIGVISNGAAAAMAVCDQINSLGGKALNFADLGGSTFHE
jgi:succinyl-CoA synthetase beta subunit